MQKVDFFRRRREQLRTKQQRQEREREKKELCVGCHTLINGQARLTEFGFFIYMGDELHVTKMELRAKRRELF